ncbi:MAG: META domain-containing protein [Pseudomonadota bacterium]
MRHAVFIVAAGLVAPTGALPAPAQTIADPYRATGTEPFWSLTMNGKTIVFERPGERPVTLPMPRREAGFNGERYQSARILVDVTHLPCNDGMSDRLYPDTVVVRIDGTGYRGCGGAPSSTPVTARMLRGEWRITAINGRAVSAETDPSLRFDGKRLSGSASCNRISATYRLRRGQLIVGPVAATRMMCGKRVQNVQEHSVMELLAQPLRVAALRGTVVLVGEGGKALVLERARRH